MIIIIINSYRYSYRKSVQEVHSKCTRGKPCQREKDPS